MKTKFQWRSTSALSTSAAAAAATRAHPASLILLGFAVLMATSSRDGMLLFLGCLSLALTASIAAKYHFPLLVRRSRWLLLSMLVMFGWLTPGTPLPGIPGASQEGLLLAAENLARLVVALSVVALILKTLPSPDLIAGLRALLAPLALLGISRDRIAVRLALTLSEVETARSGADGEPVGAAASMTLPAVAPGAIDLLLCAAAGALLLLAWLT